MWWLAQDLQTGVLSAKILSIRCAIVFANPVLVAAIMRPRYPTNRQFCKWDGRNKASRCRWWWLKKIGGAAGTRGELSMPLLLSLPSLFSSGANNLICVIFDTSAMHVGHGHMDVFLSCPTVWFLTNCSSKYFDRNTSPLFSLTGLVSSKMGGRPKLPARSFK